MKLTHLLAATVAAIAALVVHPASASCEPIWAGEYCKGTAPSCGASCGDCGCDRCLGEGKSCGDTAKCWTGTKATCLRFGSCPAGCKVKPDSCPKTCEVCPAGEFQVGSSLDLSCQKCEDFERTKCGPDAKLVGCGGSSAGTCEVIACPDGSEGQSVKSGCKCRDGFVGSILSSEVDPFYVGQCFKVCDKCPAEEAPVGTPRYTLELVKGVDVLSGDRGLSSIFAPSAYTLRDSSISRKRVVSSSKGNRAEVGKDISSNHGLELSASASGRYGLITASGTATFSKSEESKQSFEALSGSNARFCWTSQEYYIKEATLSDMDQLDEGFRSTLATLRENTSYLVFKSFFRRYGTHFVASADLGSRVNFFMTVRSEYARNVSTSYEQRCFNWAVEAGVGFNGIGKGAKVSASTSRSECEGQGQSESASSFFSQVKFDHAAEGGMTDLLLCGEPSTRYADYIKRPCLNQNNAEMFSSSLRPIWMLMAVDVSPVAEFYFYKYLTEEGTMFDAKSDRPQMPDTYLDWMLKQNAEKTLPVGENVNGATSGAGLLLSVLASATVLL